MSEPFVEQIGDLDLCYSPDDGGWYWHDWQNGADRVSVTFSDRASAVQAYSKQLIAWVVDTDNAVCEWAASKHLED